MVSIATLVAVLSLVITIIESMSFSVSVSRRIEEAEHAGAIGLVVLGQRHLVVPVPLARANLLHGLVENRELDDARRLHRLIGLERDGLAGLQVFGVDRDLAVMLAAIWSTCCCRDVGGGCAIAWTVNRRAKRAEQSGLAHVRHGTGIV